MDFEEDSEPLYTVHDACLIENRATGYVHFKWFDYYETPKSSTIIVCAV